MKQEKWTAAVYSLDNKNKLYRHAVYLIES
jgi:hypothetical protein